MRHDYQILQVAKFPDSYQLPRWADFVDVISDGGRPFRIRTQGVIDILAATGDRVPLFGEYLAVNVDADLDATLGANAGTAGAMPRLALLSKETALLTPPPARFATEMVTQLETVVHAAAGRIVTMPVQVLTRSDDAISINNASGITVWLGRTQADAEAHKAGVTANQVVNWPGGAPLFVHNPDAVNDAQLQLGIKVKRP